jgi:WD40 repeat protein
MEGKKITELKGHSDEVTVLKYFNDVLISGAEDGTIQTWNSVPVEPEVVTITDASGFQPLAISSDCMKVAFTSPEGNIHIWNSETHEELGPSFEDHFNPISAGVGRSISYSNGVDAIVIA